MVIVAAQSVLQRQQAVVHTLLRNEVVHGLRTRLYRAIAGTTWVYFSRHRASLFGQLLTQRVDRVANAAYYLLDLFVTGVIALVYIGIAFRVSAVMTLFVVTCGALLALALRGRLVVARRFGQEFSNVSNRLYTATSDHLESMKMAKGYGAERRHAERFAQLSEELGLRYNDISGVRHVSGIYRRSIEAISGKFAVIEGRDRSFALVPWRPVLERSVGQHVSGVVRGHNISWTIGRGPEGPPR